MSKPYQLAGTKCAFTLCRLTNRSWWRGLGGGGGTFWCHKETLTFKGPAA